jgi:DNA-binding transcriptional MocR family regulator
VAVLPVSSNYITAPPRAGLLIGYGAITTDRIEAGLRRLRGIVMADDAAPRSS